MTFITKGNKLFYAASAVFNYPEWVIRVYVRYRPRSVQVRCRANIISSLKNTWQEFLCPCISLGIFGWECASRDSKLAPRSKKKIP